MYGTRKTAKAGVKSAANFYDLIDGLKEGQQVLAVGAPQSEQIHCIWRKGAKEPEIWGYVNTEKYTYEATNI